MAAFLGTVPGIVPFVALLGRETPGYATLGMDLGAGPRATSFAMDLDMGSYPRRSLPVGFIGRSHLDGGGKAGVATIRIDTLALVALAGNAMQGPWRALSFALRGHLEWAWSVDVEGGRPDASLLAGVRLRLDFTEKSW